MTQKQFKIGKTLLLMAVAFIVAFAVSIDNFYLALSGVFIGMFAMYFLKTQFKKVVVDERIDDLSGKAARTTYMVTTMFLAILSMFLILQPVFRI